MSIVTTRTELPILHGQCNQEKVYTSNEASLKSQNMIGHQVCSDKILVKVFEKRNYKCILISIILSLTRNGFFLGQEAKNNECRNLGRSS